MSARCRCGFLFKACATPANLECGACQSDREAAERDRATKTREELMDRFGVTEEQVLDYVRSCGERAAPMPSEAARVGDALLETVKVDGKLPFVTYVMLTKSGATQINVSMFRREPTGVAKENEVLDELRGLLETLGDEPASDGPSEAGSTLSQTGGQNRKQVDKKAESLQPDPAYHAGSIIRGPSFGDPKRVVVGFVVEQVTDGADMWWVDTVDPGEEPSNYVLVTQPIDVLRFANDIHARVHEAEGIPAKSAPSSSPADVERWPLYEIDTDDVCTLEGFDGIGIMTGDVRDGLRMTRDTARALVDRITALLRSGQ